MKRSRTTVWGLPTKEGRERVGKIEVEGGEKVVSTTNGGYNEKGTPGRRKKIIGKKRETYVHWSVGVKPKKGGVRAVKKKSSSE